MANDAMDYAGIPPSELRTSDRKSTQNKARRNCRIKGVLAMDSSLDALGSKLYFFSVTCFSG